MPIIASRQTQVSTSRPTPINTLADGRVVIVELEVVAAEPLNGAAQELPIPPAATATVTVPMFITVTETKLVTVLGPEMGMVMKGSPPTSTTTSIARPTTGIPRQLAVPVSSTSTSSNTAPSTSTVPTVTDTSASTQSSSTRLLSLSSASSSSTSSKPSSFSPTETPSTPQPSALSSTTATQLSSGEIVGITLSSFLFLLLLCICFIRHRSKRRRKKSRETWVSPFIEKKPIMIGPTSSSDTSSSALFYSSHHSAIQTQAQTHTNQNQTTQTQTQASSYRPVLPREEKQRELFRARWSRLRGLGLGRACHTNVTSGGPGNTSAQNGNRQSTRKKKRNGDDSYTDNESHPRVQTGTRRPPGPPPNEPLPPPPAEIHRQPSSGRLLRVLRRPSQFPRNAKVTFDFHPVRDDEMEVRRGDTLRVVAFYEDGWSFCENSLGRKGFVPVNCYKEYDSRERL